MLEHIDMRAECDSGVRSLSDLGSPYETSGKKDSAVSDETEAESCLGHCGSIKEWLGWRVGAGGSFYRLGVW
jgi:hypothetical protein